MNGFSGYRGNDGLGCIEPYLKDINRWKSLSLEEEAALAPKIRNCDDEALETLVKHNLRFVVSVARKYQNQGLPMSDLVCEGNVGLITAAKKFDEKKNFKFVSYAVWYIRQAILKALAEQSRACYIPLNRTIDIGKVNQTDGCLMQKYKREPSVEEIANEIPMKLKDTVIAQKLLQGTRYLSEPINGGSHNHDKGDGICLGDSLHDKDAPATDFKAEQSDTNSYIHNVVDSLGERQSKAIRMYFGINNDHTSYTLEEMGKRFGVSREMARQIKEKALRRLKSKPFSNKLRPALQNAVI
jgi:RNA polymerase primary sigma factor